jgi:putative nucleotidyltransferase with HDIG domain
MTALARPSGPASLTIVRRAADVLHDARCQERDGRLTQAVESYDKAILLAEQRGEHTVLAEALRRLAVLRHQREDSPKARELCHRSYEVASSIGNDRLAAEALNTLGGIAMATDSLTEAGVHFREALALGAASGELRARVEQNLGILANIQGELDEASTRYRRSLREYQRSKDEHGCALAYHNLGMVSADRELFEEADGFFSRSREIAERSGHVYLQALCLVNHAEVHLARQRFEAAQEHAQRALTIFDQLGARAEKSGAWRVMGAVYRETGRHTLAETHLRSAIDIAAGAGSVLNEAEASRELALLYQSLGRNQDTLRLLNVAHRLFGRLDARRDLVNVASKMATLEDTYFDVVRQWGQSIESSDAYTFGHCERVAHNATAVARCLGLDDEAQTTIRLGAYLHDVGKVRVPSEILNKEGTLTHEEFEVIQMHPVWGVELLADIEFPWDLKPIIRWHHEKYDGSGYPDRLRGDEIPVAAQVVGIADIYDALTSDRAYRPAMPSSKAVAEISATRGHWSSEVFEAFLGAFTDPKPNDAAADRSIPVVSERAA